jgi:hypothetical protein
MNRSMRTDKEEEEESGCCVTFTRVSEHVMDEAFDLTRAKKV